MSETKSASHEDLFAAEADYWRKRAERAETALSDLVAAASRARHSELDLPPEPPVGTTLHRILDGGVAWTRCDDGWHCAGLNGPCLNCPCDWFEVVEQGGLSYTRRLP